MLLMSQSKMNLLLRIINFLYMYEIFFPSTEDQKYIEMVVIELKKMNIIKDEELKYFNDDDVENVDLKGFENVKDDHHDGDEDFIIL